MKTFRELVHAEFVFKYGDSPNILKAIDAAHSIMSELERAAERYKNQGEIDIDEYLPYNCTKL